MTVRRVRWFDCYGHFVGWHCLSLGVHVDLVGPFVEVHLPFGFLRFGMLHHGGGGGPSPSRWRKRLGIRGYPQTKPLTLELLAELISERSGAAS